MFFQIIESSSAGNCSYLNCDGVKILIDAGVGIKKVRSFLAQNGASVNELDGIFITHEHSDHFSALRHFVQSGVKVYANRPTAECIMAKDADTKKINWRIFETGGEFDFYGIQVLSFAIPHDTSDPVGFKFSNGEKNLVYATDIGKITHSIRDIASHSDILVLESNYCPLMLERSSRPYSLKMRIKSPNGHLSNADAIELLRVLPPSVKKIFLSHVSRQCNSVEHIREMLERSAIARDLLDKIEIVCPYSKPSSPVEF